MHLSVLIFFSIAKPQKYDRKQVMGRSWQAMIKETQPWVKHNGPYKTLTNTANLKTTRWFSKSMIFDIKATMQSGGNTLLDWTNHSASIKGIHPWVKEIWAF